MARVTVTHKHGTITLFNAHAADKCAGRRCVIHNPYRPNEERYLVWRDDLKWFEEICVHGMGHPTQEDVEYQRSVGGESGWHSCDGCCIGWRGYDF